MKGLRAILAPAMAVLGVLVWSDALVGKEAEPSAGSGVRRGMPAEGVVGVASRYVGDEGIERAPAVIFTGDFEADTLDDVCSRWESVRNRGLMSRSSDVPPGGTGDHSLLMTHVTAAPPGHISKVHFDDIVVAQEYMGPIMPRPRR